MDASTEEFGASFQAFMRHMAAQGTVEEPFFRKRLTDHFGADPSRLPVVAETFERYEHPNLHLAIQGFLDDESRSADVLGITSDHKGYMGVSFSHLVAPAGPGMFGRLGATEGPVEYANISLDDERVVACVKSGLYLIRDGSRPSALLVDIARDMGPFGKLKAEAIAPSRTEAEGLLASLRHLMRRQNVYRGRVISLEVDDMHSLRIRFHRLPGIERAGIILPDGLLDRIERQTIRFTQYGDRLRAAGRHLKRGVLLHGPPGTGKTLTAMYLAHAHKDSTVLLVTGRGQGLIEQSCLMARMLQPSIVIVEDVDLIAEERTIEGCPTPLLFELLNQMDGLADDADVLFLLTTNRPDLLEPALAARPGRVDLAVEIPLPDEDCRKRLFALYGKGMTMRATSDDEFVRRTEGASPAFIRELLRKAALFAADESGATAISVEDRHLDEALRDLVLRGGRLTKSLLGFQESTEDAESPVISNG